MKSTHPFEMEKFSGGEIVAKASSIDLQFEEHFARLGALGARKIGWENYFSIGLN